MTPHLKDTWGNDGRRFIAVSRDEFSFEKPDPANPAHIYAIKRKKDNPEKAELTLEAIYLSTADAAAAGQTLKIKNRIKRFGRPRKLNSSAQSQRQTRNAKQSPAPR